MLEEQESLKVLPGEESGNAPLRCSIGFPEPDIFAVRHKCEWAETLFLGYCGNIIEDLLLPHAGIPTRPLGFNDCEDFSVRTVEAIVGHPFKGRRVVPGDGNLPRHLRSVGEVPAGFSELGID